MVLIRKCRKSDLAGIRNVCYKTGYMGEDASGHFFDKTLFGFLNCCYYCKYEPEHCFVAEDHGKVVALQKYRHLSAFLQGFPLKYHH